MKLKWYTIYRKFMGSVVCIQGTSNIDAVTRYFNCANFSPARRDYYAYEAVLVNYNITRNREIV